MFKAVLGLRFSRSEGRVGERFVELVDDCSCPRWCSRLGSSRFQLLRRRFAPGVWEKSDTDSEI